MTSLSALRQDAAGALLRRRRARRKLIDFARYVMPTYRADPFHDVLAAALDEVIAGRLMRLIISAPPQHGKSQLASVLLPAMWLGQRPNDPVIISSYAADLARAKSREARTLVESPIYRTLFGDLGMGERGVKTRMDSRSVNEWQLAEPYRGGVRAVGVGGGLTGFPGTLGIIDDPIKDWQDAQSVTIREAAWDWYTSVFRTRISADGAIVIIMTRWHMDDPVGRLLSSDQRDDWTVLRFPAIAEGEEERLGNNDYLGLPDTPDLLGRHEGEALSPSRFDEGALLKLKRDVGSMKWAALYQGVPRPLEGSRMRRSWFPIVEIAPTAAKRARYWDKAGSADNTRGAATAGVLLAIAPDGTVYIEDVIRGWYSAYEREQVILQTAQADAERYGQYAVQVYVEQEPGSGGKESAENTLRNLAGFAVYADRPTGDKDTRLEPLAAQAEAGNVRLLRGQWNGAYLDEMAAVPNGTTRDMVDATAGAFNRLSAAEREVAMRQGRVRKR